MQSAQQGSPKPGSKYVLPPDYSFRFIWHRNHVAGESLQRSSPSITISDADEVVVSQNVATENVSDTDRRAFLKILGTVGLGVVGASLVPDKASALVMGGSPATSVMGVKDAANARVNPAKEDGNLASIKTNTDPLVAAGAGGYIRQDSTATIAKETGGNLAAIKTNTDKLTFDGNGNLLTASTGAVTGIVSLRDTANTTVNPATDDSILYLRRMVKLMESQATVDTANRQRVAVDTAVISSGTVTTVTTVSSLTNIGSWDARQMFQDQARNVYSNAIRSNLIYSS